jgi:hypothetical protein
MTITGRYSAGAGLAHFSSSAHEPIFGRPMVGTFNVKTDKDIRDFKPAVISKKYGRQYWHLKINGEYEAWAFRWNGSQMPGTTWELVSAAPLPDSLKLGPLTLIIPETYTNLIDGWMSPEDLEFLFESAKRMSSIVEIGSWKGRSTHALLSGCPGTVHAVDHFKGSLAPQASGLAREAARVDIHAEFLRNVGHFPNLVVHRMKSLEAAPGFLDKSIDMVFIDGEHLYEDVKADILAWLPKTVKLICGHDYQIGPGWESACAGVVKAVDEIFGPVNHAELIWWKALEEL